MSAGASRELARRQLSGKHDSPPPKSRLSAPHLAATAAATSQPTDSGRPSLSLPSPPAAPTTLPPPPKGPAPASDAQPDAALPAGPAVSAGIQPAGKTESSLAGDPPSGPETTAAAVPVKIGESDVASGPGTAAQTDAPPAHAPPLAEEPPLKRPKLQFGKGLASRMSSAAQSDLTLPESSAVPTETQQAQLTPALETQADAQIESQSEHNMPGQAQAEQLKPESSSPSVAETSLEDLLAQNSPGSLHRSSWVQIHKDLQTLNNHKARLQVSPLHRHLHTLAVQSGGGGGRGGGGSCSPSPAIHHAVSTLPFCQMAKCAVIPPCLLQVLSTCSTLQHRRSQQQLQTGLPGGALGNASARPVLLLAQAASWPCMLCSIPWCTVDHACYMSCC